MSTAHAFPWQQCRHPALIVAGLQLAALLLWGPRYDFDLHFYTKGLMQWEIQHPPGYTLFLLGLWHVWPSVWLPVAVHVLVYSAACGVLLCAVFPETQSSKLRFGGAVLLGLEPLVQFYQVSLLSEGLFISLLMLATAAACWAWRGGYLGAFVALGCYLALALAVRYASLLSLPWLGILALAWLLWGTGPQRWQKLGWALGLPLLALVLLWGVQRLRNGAELINQSGRLAFDNCSHFYRPGDAPDTLLATCIAAEKPDASWADYEHRYLAGARVHDCYVQALMKQGHSFNEAYMLARASLQTTADRIRNRHSLDLRLDFWKHNLWRLAHKNELEYRWRPGPHAQVALAADYAALDSMALRLYRWQYEQKRTPSYWHSATFANVYLWGIYAVGLVCLTLLAWFSRAGLAKYLTGWLLYLAWLLPQLLLVFTIIPYKTRFVAVYTPLLLVASLWLGHKNWPEKQANGST